MKALAKNTLRFVFVLFFIFSISLSLIIPTAALAPNLDKATSVVLYSVDADEILLSKNPDISIYPSATVKIMSSLLLCEMLGDKLDNKLTVTEEMLIGATGRNFGLRVGDTMSVLDVLRVAVCGSYNDAFCALAVYSSGSLSSFIELMNQKAKALGTTSSNFSNVTGIDSPKAKTSARDILKICLAASKNELYMALNSTYSYPVTLGSGTTKTVENRNELHNIYGKYFNSHALGFASGMTDLGGYCLATLGSYGDAKYICIVMGATENFEYELANSLLSYAAENYSLTLLKSRGTYVGEIPVSLSDTHTKIDLVLADDIKILSSDGDAASEITYDLVLSSESLAAPFEKGKQVGFYVVRQGGCIIACIPVVTAENVGQNNILAALNGMKSAMTSRVAGAFFVFFFVELLAFFVVYLIRKRRKRKRAVYARGRYR